MAFIVPFGLLNSRPKSIYLGDAGSFAFASFLTAVAVIYFVRGDLAAEVAIPLALPTLDTAYVFCVRIIEKHDLLTRNYLHLYQKLEKYYPRFVYLLPQVINAAIVLVVSMWLKTFGINDFAAVTVAMFVVTLPFYFACRRWLLPREGD
jgi:UDP-N-acetylmuramyl pentapeptide phosphotransferase/UDP-N-acetylglucosamine-1-phosphate transferase